MLPYSNKKDTTAIKVVVKYIINLKVILININQFVYNCSGLFLHTIFWNCTYMNTCIKSKQ